VKKTIFTKNHHHLVNRLIKARKEAGLKQKDVARILERTQSYVSKFESGERRIDIVQLKNLAKIYKKNIDYFLR